ncbi:hypothetical protein K5K93_03830 [Stenotrophomonas sp. DR822]|uniref:hypothetical protein n=1 Tax=Stenotrophomonas sp. DR822 TaxID=2871174 RepID=UPI001C95B00B|nr:hypothetical protein [Stenotrophomonas sp. DR822]QZN81571.1 hypothetical protein K5K93_03830 [Stenotrophomonas sp. DR822]
MVECDKDVDSSRIKVHFFYVVLILGGTIAVLVTKKWTEVDGFVNYLSVASGVTSLVLGILAIIYSFVSTGTFSKSVGSINSQAERVASVANELATVLNSGESLQSRAEMRTEELHRLIGDLRVGLDSLQKTTLNIAGSVESISPKIDALQKGVVREPEGSSRQVAREAEHPEWTEAGLKQFFYTASLQGVAAVYGALRAKEMDRYINYQALFGDRDSEYIWGFLVGVTCSGVAKFEGVGGSMTLDSTRIKVILPAVKGAVISEMERRTTHSDSVRRKASLRIKAKIDDYFAVEEELGDDGSES